MKPIAASLPTTTPQSGGPIRAVTGKSEKDDQRFSDVLGQHEELIRTPIVGEQLGSEQVMHDEIDLGIIANASRQPDEFAHTVFPDLVTTGDAINPEETSSVPSVELDQLLLQEVQGDQLFGHQVSDLAARTQNFIGAPVNTRAVAKPINEIQKSEPDAGQISRLTSQLEATVATTAVIPPNKLDANMLREGARSGPVEQSVPFATKNDVKVPLPPSTSIASDPTRALSQKIQSNQKSQDMNFAQPVAAAVITSLGDKRSNLQTANFPTSVTKVTTETVSAQTDRTVSSIDFRSILFDQVDTEERGRPVVMPGNSVEVSNSPAATPLSAPNEKPVGSQVAQFLLSNLGEPREKSGTSTAPIFMPVQKTAVVLKSLNLELQPGNLGTVKIELSLKNQNLTVELVAENAEAADRLQASQEMIHKKMKSDGYVIDQFVIKTADVTRVGEVNRNSESFAAMENKESEQFSSKENGASGFGESERHQSEQQNMPAIERVPEADGRRDDEIYL